jgi:hypothetical protein
MIWIYVQKILDSEQPELNPHFAFTSNISDIGETC